MAFVSCKARLASALGAVLILASCGSDTGTGPAKPADPLGTAANIQALYTSFNAPAFQSFALAAAQSPAGASPLRAMRALLRAAQPILTGRRGLTPAESRLAAAPLGAALVRRGDAAHAPIFPPGVVLGTTYEWNPTTSVYEPTSRAGAPTNGLRFILYALDFGTPIVSQEIGYVDFLDEDPGGTAKRLHILVVGTTPDPDVTYLDYTINSNATSISASGSVLGFITDGTHRLDFNVTTTENQNSVTFDIRFDVNAQNAHVQQQLTITAPSASTLRVAIIFRLQFGSEVVTVTGTDTVDFTAQTESATLTVRVNGGLYATVTVSNGDVNYSGGGGQQLTADDLTALNAIVNAIGQVLLFTGELLAPTGSVTA